MMYTHYTKKLSEYQNGNYNVIICEDGTKIRQTEEDEFVPEFAENIDLKITNRCDMNCKFCHEGSTSDGNHSDIMNEKFIDTLHPYQELAVGGGNVLSHPDFISFLEKLKEKHIITNITLNQKHFMDNIGLIHKLVDEKLIYGLGVSLMNPTISFVGVLKQFDNAVIHVINGIVTDKDIYYLSDEGLKLLILGYKDLRRGDQYLKSNEDMIKKNQNWLKTHLDEIINEFKVVSFDNLAIEQLDVKNYLSKEEYDQFYMGDDGQYTFYIDAVERKFAKSSTAELEKRYDLLDSVDDMFKVISMEA